MNCSKCGEALIPGNRFCTNCGTSITTVATAIQTNQAIPVVYQSNDIDDNKKGNMLCVYSLLSYFLGPIVVAVIIFFLNILSAGATSFLSFFSVTPRIAAYVLVGVARSKYPNNTFSKILMWVYIGLFALGFIIGVLVIILIIIALYNY